MLHHKFTTKVWCENPERVFACSSSLSSPETPHLLHFVLEHSCAVSASFFVDVNCPVAFLIVMDVFLRPHSLWSPDFP